MAKVEAATGGLVTRYLDEVRPDLYGNLFTRRRIEAEFADHLMEAVERFIDQGCTQSEAEERAVARFGSPAMVAKTFAQSKGVGVPTQFTRYGGLSMILGVTVVAAALIAAGFSESFGQGWFAEIAFSGSTLLAVGLLAIYMRVRGQLGRLGRLGFRAMLIGFVVAMISSSLWFVPGSVVGIAAWVGGAGAYIVAMFRTEVLPRHALMLMAGAFAVSLPVGTIGWLTNLDTDAIAGSVGFTGFTVGLCWIGLYLWSEKPQDVPTRESGLIA